MGKSGSTAKGTAKSGTTSKKAKPAEATPTRTPRPAASVPTRVSADIAAAAAAVGAAEHRSAAEQINYWARVGMEVERSNTFAHRKVLAVAAGEEQFATLNPDERLAAHALVQARIYALAADARFGEDARARGETTVSLDDEGRLVEIAPDGARRYL